MMEPRNGERRRSARILQSHQKVTDLVSPKIAKSRPSGPTARINNHQAISQPAKKRTQRELVDPDAERPLKRAKLTAGNLKKLEMGGRRRKSEAKKSAGESSTTTTTTGKHFGPRLQRNGIIYHTLEAKDANDIAQVKQFLDQPRASEPPDEVAYKRYLILTEDYDNELSVEICAYPLLSKRNSSTELSGYLPRVNHAWSAVDNHLTKGLSDAQPDVAESYRATDFPAQVIEALSADLAPSAYNESMPTYAVEFKSSGGDMKEAKLQCAYDGALMTAAAEAVNEHIQPASNDFYGSTQAITVAMNGEDVTFFGHHALRVPANFGNLDTATAILDNNAATVEYHQYRITSDHPRDSHEDFQKAHRHVRNAQYLGYKLATERKDALWAHAESVRLQAANTPLTPPESSNVAILMVAQPEEPPQPTKTTQTKQKKPRRKAAVGEPRQDVDAVVAKPKSRRPRKSQKKNA